MIIASIFNAPSLKEVVFGVMQFILSLAGGLAVIVMISAGVMYMTSGGVDERVSTSKRFLVAGIVGLCIIVLALAIVRGLSTTLTQ